MSAAVRQPRHRVCWLLLAAAFVCPTFASAQSTAGSQTSPPQAGKPVDTSEIDAGQAGAEDPRRQLVRWNDYRGPHFTFRFGGGILYEVAGFSQDAASRTQFDLEAKDDIRDSRVLFKGGFPSLKRKVTYTSGIMYNGPTDEWLVRETGVMVEIPELWGHVFVGRTKEGFSLNKVMTGYAGWTMERATMNDATIPILADGIKWLGYSPNHRWIWNVGWYGDWLSKHQTFSTFHRQTVARVAWLPIHDEASGRLLHVGGNFRYGKPEDGVRQLKSRPEAFPAPNFVDTGQFPAVSTRMAGYEIYLRNGSWLFGSEYWFEDVNSRRDGEPAQPGDDPRFKGGDVAVTWLITGETRGYNTTGGYFRAVSPARPVFEGGPGAWELVVRFSRIDLDSREIRGGKFWRFTPMMNWHLSDQVRLEMTYGYGRLNRFDVVGGTHFFQSRLQLTF